MPQESEPPEIKTSAHGEADNAASGIELQKRSKGLIEGAVLDLLREKPDELTADDVRASLGDAVLTDPNFRSEMMGGAFSALLQRGFIERIGSKTSQWPGMKNRRIPIYRAATKLRRQLGLDAVTSETLVPDSTADVLSAIYAFAQHRGFICTIVDVVNFYLCLQAKPFVVLSGISGTGKSSLPRIFADAIGAPFVSVPVKPNWTDNSYLMGYFSVTLNDFISGPLTEATQEAIAHLQRPYFVRLDEMNLAHVEHYLSDLLSVMETSRTDSKGLIKTDPLPLDLPLAMRGTDSARDKRWDELAALFWPFNIFLVGTVNVDETTHPFSRKVLDRAFAIDFSDVDLGSFGAAQSQIPPPTIPIPAAPGFLLDRPGKVGDVYPDNKEFFDQIAALLEEVNNHLREAELHFAYRVRDEICLYMWAWKRHTLESLLSERDAFDLCLYQKILPRCHGASETARRVIQRLFFFSCGQSPEDTLQDLDQLDARFSLAGRPYRRTSQKLMRMLRQYRDTGAFSFWVG